MGGNSSEQHVRAAVAEAAVSSAELRRAMGHFATGVAIVTARDAECGPVGTTVSAITSLSLDPPLVLVCFDLTSTTLDAVRRHGAFAINVLGDRHGRLARRFAQRGGDKPWHEAVYRLGATGTPRLESALATLECRVDDRLAGGDHEIVLGRVLDIETAAPDLGPLLFYRGAFTSLSDA